MSRSGTLRQILAGRYTFPAAMLVLSLLYVAAAMRPPAAGPYRLADFGRIPVVDQGRIKPVDTLARISLMVLSNKQTLWVGGEQGSSIRTEVENYRKAPAVRWLLDVMARPDKARDYHVFRIDHSDVLSLIGATQERKYFGFNEIMQHREVLSDQIDRARAAPSGARTPFQRNLLRLSQQLSLYFTLEEVVDLMVVPPEQAGEEWMSIAAAQRQAAGGGPLQPTVEPFIQILQSWHDAEPDSFNLAIADYRRAVNPQLHDAYAKGDLETFFNRFAPFIRAMGLYVLVFMLAALSWLRMSRSLSAAALWVLFLALALHTIGLVARIHIQGRPPVTNLYSSAVFVGWGCAVLGAVLERMYRNGVGSVSAAVCGFLSLLVAHNLSLDGDTMTMMQAVLDTNFWLATHVITITLGYASTFLAGFLGTLYIVRGVFTRSLSREEAGNLSRMIYGIICFAALFSFVGTLLGGIWADQSWGRFWGWDPKENGALIIVLWNALVLHARWSGMARRRGIAVLAVGGNIITAWSWFGTNMLGVGLHAYGFIDKAVVWMFVFVMSQLVLMGIGMLPQPYWRSFREGAAAAATPPRRRAASGRGGA